MDNEKRTLLAIVLSMAILFGWYAIFPPEKKAPEEVTIEKVESAAGTPLAELPSVKIDLPKKQEGQLLIIETPLYVASFDSLGARLVSLKLKKYHVSMDEGAPLVEMIETPLPTVAITADADDSRIVFQPSATGFVQAEEAYELTYSAEVAAGVVQHKIFSIDPESYVIGFKNVIDNRMEASAALDIAYSLKGHYPVGEKPSRYSFEGPVWRVGKELDEFKLSKIDAPGKFRPFGGEVKWFGYEDKYFLTAMLPATVRSAEAKVERLDNNFISLRYSAGQAKIAAGEQQSDEFRLYIGPKEISSLKAVGQELDKALSFGFFDFLAKPLLMAMNWIQSHIGSYGFAIIILTFIIKFLLYPLTFKSFKSMKELQKVQPLMKEIQEQYKDDKQQLNQQMMKLYQEHSINPMGGCLPMLLQIPILFALYRVFFAAIELRHTSFHIFGTWLPDLSAKDPYFITPILMGLSQFVMQKMTPSAGDPTQQKIMLVMPVMFTFLFMSFPSGLVMYWLISNIISILQQTYINRVHT